MPQDQLVVRGAREHNLKDVDGRVPARPAGRHHRPVRQRQEQPRLRHDLRRGPAPLRREPERLRPPVPRPDGEAGRRPDRRPVPGDLDRPEGRVAQPALDGRDRHRDLRPPAAAVRPDRHPALPERPRDRAPDGPADRRPGAGPARGHAAARARAAHQGPQDRGRPRLRGRPAAGLRPRPGRRRDGTTSPTRRRSTSTSATRSRSSSTATSSATPKRPRAPSAAPDGRPIDPETGQPIPDPDAAAPGRLDRDRAPARRGRRPDRARRRATTSRPSFEERRYSERYTLPVRRLHDRRARAAQLLVQLAARRLPGLHRARDEARDRPGPRHPGPVEEPASRARSCRGRGCRPTRRGGSRSSRRSASPTAGTSRRRSATCRPRRSSTSSAPRRTRRSSSATATSAARTPTRRRSRAIVTNLERRYRETDSEYIKTELEKYMVTPALPDLRRQAAQAGGPRGHGRRPRRSPTSRRCRSPTRSTGSTGLPPKLTERERTIAVPGPQGDRGPARVPRRRRARLPDPRPDVASRCRAARPSGSGWRPRSGRR